QSFESVDRSNTVDQFLYDLPIIGVYHDHQTVAASQASIITTTESLVCTAMPEIFQSVIILNKNTQRSIGIHVGSQAQRSGFPIQYFRRPAFISQLRLDDVPGQICRVRPQ